MIDETLLEAEEKMEKAVEVAKEDFAGIRTGRADPGHVQQAHRRLLRRARRRCSSSRRSRRPRPARSSSRRSTSRRWREIEKALRDSDLGVNPSNDGNVIRCVLPAAHRGAPQGVHQAGPAQGRGRQGLDPQHPPQGQGRAGQAGQGRRGRRGRGQPRREGARRDDEEVRRHRRRAAQGQGGRAARGLSALEPTHERRMNTPQSRSARREAPTTAPRCPQRPPRRRDSRRRGERPRPCPRGQRPSKAGRNLPAAIGVGRRPGRRSSSARWSCARSCMLGVVVAAIGVGVWELRRALAPGRRSTCRWCRSSSARSACWCPPTRRRPRR